VADTWGTVDVFSIFRLTTAPEV